jgi:hypothetical protein
MTQETKDVAIAGLATAGSSMLTIAQVNEILQTIAYVLTISITAYKFYWSIRRSILRYREEQKSK